MQNWNYFIWKLLLHTYNSKYTRTVLSLFIHLPTNYFWATLQAKTVNDWSNGKVFEMEKKYNINHIFESLNPYLISTCVLNVSNTDMICCTMILFVVSAADVPLVESSSMLEIANRFIFLRAKEVGIASALNARSILALKSCLAWAALKCLPTAAGSYVESSALICVFYENCKTKYW